MANLSAHTWERRHANNWIARVVRDADDAYRYHAQGRTDIRPSGAVGTLEDAQLLAGAAVASHECGPDCGDWRPNR